jgi:hypothetical protein
MVRVVKGKHPRLYLSIRESYLHQYISHQTKVHLYAFLIGSLPSAFELEAPSSTCSKPAPAVLFFCHSLIANHVVKTPSKKAPTHPQVIATMYFHGIESSQYPEDGVDSGSYAIAFTGSSNKFVVLVVPAVSMGPFPVSSSLKRLLKAIISIDQHISVDSVVRFVTYSPVLTVMLGTTQS